MEKSAAGWEVTDADVYDAMREIPGYLDITAADFRTLYIIAQRHAMERLRSSLRVRDLMTADVVTVKPDAPLHEVAEAMDRHGVSGVPVIDGNRRVVGVISERDFVTFLGGGGPRSIMGLIAACLEGGGCLTLPVRRQNAAEIMSAPPITVSETAAVAEAAAVMLAHDVNRLPVVDPENRLVGILTRGDLVRAHAI